MAPAGIIGYAIAAAGYLLLTVLLVAAWEGRSAGARLILATGITAAWGASLAFLSIRPSPALMPVALADTLRNAAWLAALAQLAGTGQLSRGLVRIAYAAAAGLLILIPATGALMPSRLQDLVTAGGLALPLIGLVLLEQIYRSSGPSGRWGLLHLYAGLGGVLVYDVFLYSQALLLDGISLDAWLARGFVTVLAVPLLAVAARRNVAWSLRVFVSRDVVFHTTTFVAVGGYLLLMAAGGYVVRLVGGSWGGVGEIVFLAAAVGLLAVLVGSSALRQRVRVFLVKHFYRNKYDYRDEWLRFIATLSSASRDETAPVTAIGAVAQIIGSPGAALLVPTEGLHAWRLEAAWPVGEILDGSARALDLGDTLVDWLGRRQWVIDLAEYRHDRDAYVGLDVPDWLTDRHGWRLVVPVMLRDKLFGMLLLQEPGEGFELTFEDRDLLKTTARHIATHISQHESERRLAEDREFAAFNKLSAFMMHDLKNIAAQLELVVGNAARHKDNPEFIEDAIETVGGVARRIAGLIASLQPDNSEGNPTLLAVADVVQVAVDRCASRMPRPDFRPAGEELLVRVGRERLANVIEHVIHNAQDAAASVGSVVVKVSKMEESAVIEVTDDGAGMSAEFVREHLFRPFDSTKGSKGMGIGAYQAREYVRSLGGFVEVESSPGCGTRFRMFLPLAHGTVEEGAAA